MPDEATSQGQPVQQHQLQSPFSISDGLSTSNATSNRFLGEQQRSWMVLPNQSLPGIETPQIPQIPQAPQSPGEHSRRARQTQRGIANLLNSNRSEQDRQLLPDSQLQQANNAIGVALNRGQHIVAEQISRSFQPQPHKRPRLDLQTRTQPPTLPQAHAAPFYGFVGSPTQTTHSPGANAPIMSPLPRTMNSSSVVASASTPVDLQQGHIPHQMYSTNGSTYPSPRTASSAHPPAQHSQSSISSMPGSGAQNPASRITTSNSHGQRPIQQDSTKRISTTVYLPRLQAIMTDPQTRDAFKDWASQRIVTLEEACSNEDWFYLIFHQIYCWQSVNRNAMPKLGIIGNRELTLAGFEVMLLPNKFNAVALQWFSHFPIDPEIVLMGTSPDALRALRQIHIFLDKMCTEGPQLSASCLARQYPPSPYELYTRLGLSSTVLQSVFFTFVFRQIERANNGSWHARGIQFFKLTQSQLVDKMNRITMGLPEAAPNMESSLAQFASEYFALRNTYASRPVMPRTTTSSIPHVAQTPTAVASNLPPPPPPLAQRTAPPPHRALANNSHARLSNSSSGRSRVPSDLNTGVVTHIPQLSVSQPQPAPSNNGYANPTMGPRQQDYVQEMTRIPAMPDARLANTNRRASGSSSALQHGTIANTFSPPVPGTARRLNAQVPPNGSLVSPTVTSHPENGRLRTPLANGASLTQNGHSARPKPTPFLPPAGKQMQLNTHPNPDYVGLHQARLYSPEPRIIGLEEHVQTSPRLFLVLQRFVLPPQLVTKKQTYYEWQIDISGVDASRKATDLPIPANRPTSKVYRAFKKGSVTYRFRCVMQPGASQSAPTEAEWSIAPNHFPSICFVSLNMSEIPIRRKSHFGKNLACDLTPGIKAGRNTVEMSVHLSAEEKSRIFVVAVEQIETFDQLQCTQQLMLIEQPVSLAAIVASLTSANDDDEIAIVDPHISIDLIDPFTAQICRIPVRGKSCTHRECFDLQAFLESRPSKVKGVPLTSADEWKCPICNKDARPQCLLLDGLLLNVCTQARGEETEEVKAIMVSADGGWKWKVENRRQAEREGSDGPGLAVWRDRNMNRESSRSTPSKDTIIKDAGMGRLEVIELDDD